MPSSAANFHVYVIREYDNLPYHLASCEEDGLGACLRVLAEEEQIRPIDNVGILMRDADDERGVWFISPFAGRGRSNG